MAKGFDSVKLMREIREKLSRRYVKSRDSELEELKKKFGHLREKKTKTKIK